MLDTPAALRVVITGAARGIGADLARGLAAAGARVVCLDKREDRGREIAESIGAAARFLQCDVSDPASVAAAFAGAAAWLGGLGALVASAGLDKPGHAAEDIPPEIWDLVLAVNARGTFLTNQAAFRLMKGQGGAIVNLGSFGGIRGMPDRAAYAAAKGAVFAWTRSVAQAWGPHDVTVNAIAPVMRTEAADRFIATLSEAERNAHEARVREITPMGGRLGDPTQDLLPLVQLLIGPGGRYITGQAFAVDGGRTMLGS